MRNRKLAIMLIILSAFALFLILGSVIFSVQHIDVYCYDGANELDRQIASASIIKKGQNIFSVDERRVAREYEKKFGYNIKITQGDIERKFPNRVGVSYRLMPDVFEYSSFGSAVAFREDGIVTKTAASQNPLLISVLVSFANSVGVGTSIVQANQEFEAAIEIFDAFTRFEIDSGVGMNTSAVLNLVASIDLTVNERITINLRNTNCRFVLVKRDMILQKLHKAFTLFSEKDEQKTGTITVANNLIAAWDD